MVIIVKHENELIRLMEFSFVLPVSNICVGWISAQWIRLINIFNFILNFENHFNFNLKKKKKIELTTKTKLREKKKQTNIRTSSKWKQTHLDFNNCKNMKQNNISNTNSLYHYSKIFDFELSVTHIVWAQQIDCEK